CCSAPAMAAVRLVLRGAVRAVCPALPAVPRPCPSRSCGEAATLRDMGFNPEQTQRLLALQPRLGPEAAAAQLLLLGLSSEAAVSLLERSPALLRLPAERLRERAEQLRRLGLDGGSAGRRGGCGAYL
ncbi:MTEF4 factor, partial [Sakesphorus luctuosus]|nr:MTEF4 factor [Sakesphorus luctuosus]